MKGIYFVIVGNLETKTRPCYPTQKVCAVRILSTLLYVPLMHIIFSFE